jgi:hypothetical protein
MAQALGLMSVARICALLTTNAAPMSSTDQDGGLRAGVQLARVRTNIALFVW